MNRLEKKLESRIGEQVRLIKRRLRPDSTPSIENYYWGASKPPIWGLAAPPRAGRPIAPQLLLTPNLIVDILPMSDAPFRNTYGLTPDQMSSLAEEGFIVPNIYQYRNNGWREYAKYPGIARLLASDGRPNTEWITHYLDRQHNFDAARSEATEFFRSIKLTPSEQKAILSACHGRIQVWESFAPAYGHRLAYLRVLGGGSLDSVFEWIQEAYRDSSRRVSAIRLLHAAQLLNATKTTAAYGGYVTDIPEHLADIRASMANLRQLTSAKMLAKSRAPDSRLAVAVEFAELLASRVLKIRAATPKHDESRKFPYHFSAEQFKSFKRVLRSIRDGRLGRMIDGMTEALADPNSKLEPTLDEYRELALELDGGLLRLGGLAKFLNRVGSSMLKVDEWAPPTDPMLGWFFWSGITLKTFSGALAEVEAAPLFRVTRHRRLCGHWAAVKKTLGLTEYTR